MGDLIDGETAIFAGTFISLVIGTIVHEFGHALAAWSVGLPPRLIMIGQGPILARLRVRRAWLVVKRAPIGGYMHAEIGPDTSARQRFVTTAGGPAATLLLLAVVLGVLVFVPAPLTARLFLQGCVIGQAVILAGSLVPFERRRKTHVSISDAMRLWRLAKGEHRGAFARIQADLLRRHLPEGAAPPAPSRHFPELVFQRTRRDRKTDAWAQDEVAASMRALLAHDDLPDAERSLAQELLGLSEAHQRVRDARAELANLRLERRLG